MITTELAKTRVVKFLAKKIKRGVKGWDYSDAPDKRQQAKVNHPMGSLLWTLELGLTSNQRTLRDVEEMTQTLGPWARRLIPKPISDTTLDTQSQRLDAEYLRDMLVQRVRGFHRSKMLAPFGVPCGVASVDGKNLATLDHDADGTGHKRSKDNDKWHLNKQQEATRGESYFLMPALRATLSSAEAKPCIYQLPLPTGVGESTAFPKILAGLKEAYGHGDMFRIIDADAGLTSLANADLVINAGYQYVFGLKGNQIELHQEAKALLLPLTDSRPPEIERERFKRWGLRPREPQDTGGDRDLRGSSRAGCGTTINDSTSRRVAGNLADPTV